MRDSNDVICQATADHVKQLAIELDVRPKRMYELLSTDNPYPKLWRILRPLGRLFPAGLRLVQADFNARCEQILSPNPDPVTARAMHKELSDVVQAHLAHCSAAEERREINEALAVLHQRQAELNGAN